MRQLVENIVSDNLVTASRIFESRLDEIVEKKLYEKKKQMQAEVFGGLTLAQIQARKELGWKKASDVLPDPRGDDTLIRRRTKRKKSVAKRKIKEDVNRAEVEKEKEKLKSAGKDQPDYSHLKKTFSRSEMPSMSSYARRAELEKRRQQRIATMDPSQAVRLMTTREIGKEIGKKVLKKASGAAGRVAGEIASYSNLE